MHSFLYRRGSALLAMLLLLLVATAGDEFPTALSESSTPPNILFIVMDDVGIDQMVVRLRRRNTATDAKYRSRGEAG